jgi:RNA polymerase sigma factor (sigma-70 family)
LRDSIRNLPIAALIQKNTITMTITTKDREAFGEIVRQYQNLDSAVTYSITGNRQTSEDLAQETFITAWKNQNELRDAHKLPAWLCGIARNLANNWIRRTQLERQARCEATLEEIPATISPDESESEERVALLWATLKDIPLRFREPLVMYYQQNQSVADIATALELTEATVRQRIARGR